MKFTKTVLNNGLRIITVPMTDNPSVTILVMVEAGSKYETKKQNGISHFLEHMVFKGTPRRPKASDISRELDSLGAHYNAFTTQEFTGYYAKAASRSLDSLIDIVSDMYMNPLFDEAEITKEKGVIIEEVRMYNDLPQRRVHEILGELMFGDQPAGWSVLGSEENIRAFSREDFTKYRKDNYVSSATTVLVAGSFDEGETISKIEKAFSSVVADPKKAKLAVTEEQQLPAIKTFFKETDQTHLVIAARTFSITDPRIPTMAVLTTILGGGMSSRLFSKMRDELGICYYIRASHDASTDHGEISISAGVDNVRVEEAVREILKQCVNLKNDLVSPAELKKVKDYISGTTLLELETSESRAEYCGVQEILKKRIDTPEEFMSKVSAVTADDIQKLARQIFVDKGLNMAIIGKFQSGDGFESYFKFDL
ncbi:MAG: pitrilysin family protein [Candidatus Taylorbacteria bacterium]